MVKYGTGRPPVYCRWNQLHLSLLRTYEKLGKLDIVTQLYA